jgi:hypothetical protein
MPIKNYARQRYYKKYGMRVGIICDKFLWDLYKDVAKLEYVSPNTPFENLDGIKFLFVTTAWTGLNNDWIGLAKDGSAKRKAAEGFIEYCNTKRIPVVFYSKEDPPHYNDYVSLAKLCSIVFTTCQEVVDKYKVDCGHNKVYPLRFGCNPVEHNPIGLYRQKEDTLIFAGTWYANRFPERNRDMHMLLRGAADAGFYLEFYDRQSVNLQTTYAFPEEYKNFVHPSLKHEELLELHKRHNWAMNVTTVKDSVTMFPNRVYELEAMGVLQLSNYSPAINNHTPLVRIAHSQYDAAQILIKTDEDDILEAQEMSIRHAWLGCQKLKIAGRKKMPQ